MKNKKVKIISVDISSNDQSVNIESEILRLMNEGVKKRYILERLGCDAKIYKRVSRRKWKKNNPDKVRESSKKRYRNNKEYYKERSQEWRNNNPERVREKNREWRENNPEKVRVHSRRYEEDQRKVVKFKELLKLKEGLKNIKQEG